MANTPLGFFLDEERNGFYISPHMKQAWAAQLQVLSVIDDICTKHGIQYSADWGTLLAAVRHGGYIPWDDDLDICMKREDYEAFRRAAARELPNNFFIQDYASQKDHWLFIAKVVNKNSMCFEEQHLNQYHNFPYIACVDIFVLDHLYQDEQLERARCEEVKYLLSVAEGILNHSFTPDIRQKLLLEIGKRYKVRWSAPLDVRQTGVEFYRLIEQQMARVSARESDLLGQIFPWVLKWGSGFSANYYQKTVRIPFEFIEIPVPHSYDVVTGLHYGKYLEAVKGVAGHDYPFYEKQKAALEAAAGHSLEGFRLKQYEPAPRDFQESDTLKSLARECMSQLDQLCQAVGTDLPEDATAAAWALTDAQQIAVDLGTLIEHVKGNDASIGCLEQFCEAVFLLYEALTGGQEKDQLVVLYNKLLICLEQVVTQVQSSILEQKSMVLCPTTPERFQWIQKYVEQTLQEEDWNVYVVPLPYFRKDALGCLSEESLYDLSAYPQELQLFSYRDFPLAMLHPERIVIAEPFDAEHPVLSVPQAYYSDRLRQHCDELVLRIPFQLDEFSENDYCDTYNVTRLLNTPGLVNADRILVETDSMKNSFARLLVELTGVERENYWQEHIQVMHDTTATTKSFDMQLLYCIGANEMAECASPEAFLKAVRRRFEVFEAQSISGMKLAVTTYPECWESFSSVDANATMELKSIMEEYSHKAWCHIYDLSEAEMEADRIGTYYGAVSPLVPVFLSKNKAVMIASTQQNME